jgi:hypothetical protein
MPPHFHSPATVVRGLGLRASTLNKSLKRRTRRAACQALSARSDRRDCYVCLRSRARTCACSVCAHHVCVGCAATMVERGLACGTCRAPLLRDTPARDFMVAVTRIVKQTREDAWYNFVRGHIDFRVAQACVGGATATDKIELAAIERSLQQLLFSGLSQVLLPVERGLALARDDCETRFAVALAAQGLVQRPSGIFRARPSSPQTINDQLPTQIPAVMALAVRPHEQRDFIEYVRSGIHHSQPDIVLYVADDTYGDGFLIEDTSEQQGAPGPPTSEQQP